MQHTSVTSHSWSWSRNQREFNFAKPKQRTWILNQKIWKLAGKQYKQYIGLLTKVDFFLNISFYFIKKVQHVIHYSVYSYIYCCGTFMKLFNSRHHFRYCSYKTVSLILQRYLKDSPESKDIILTTLAPNVIKALTTGDAFQNCLMKIALN